MSSFSKNLSWDMMLDVLLNGTLDITSHLPLPTKINYQLVMSCGKVFRHRKNNVVLDSHDSKDLDTMKSRSSDVFV